MVIRVKDKMEYDEAQKIKAEDDFKYNTNQRIQNMQFAIDMINKSLSSSIASIGSLDREVKTQIQEVLNLTISSLKEFRQTLGDMQKELQSTNKIITNMRSLLENYVEYSTYKKEIDHIKESLKQNESDKNSMRKEYNGLIERTKIEFTTTSKALKEDILSIPSEIPALRNLMEQKIELVELNGQNAVLRSSNNEKQLLLFERKIDNLYQLLKRLEMANEETK